jgi:hypothetical protein
MAQSALSHVYFACNLSNKCQLLWSVTAKITYASIMFHFIVECSQIKGT